MIAGTLREECNPDARNGRASYRPAARHPWHPAAAAGRLDAVDVQTGVRVARAFVDDTDPRRSEDHAVVHRVVVPVDANRGAIRGGLVRIIVVVLTDERVMEDHLVAVDDRHAGADKVREIYGRRGAVTREGTNRAGWAG